MAMKQPPSNISSHTPTNEPAFIASDNPSDTPTTKLTQMYDTTHHDNPSQSPTINPTVKPNIFPSVIPTNEPAVIPSDNLITTPTNELFHCDPHRENVIFALLFLATFSIISMWSFLDSGHLLGVFSAGLCFCTDVSIHHIWQPQTKCVLQWILRIFLSATFGFSAPAVISSGIGKMALSVSKDSTKIEPIQLVTPQSYSNTFYTCNTHQSRDRSLYGSSLIEQTHRQQLNKYKILVTPSNQIDSNELGIGMKYYNKENKKSITKPYKEVVTMRFVPSACLVDLEPGIREIINRQPSMGAVFKPDNIYFGASGGNNWSKGYYTQGAKLIVEAVDIIRCETEGCQCLQQFQLTISIGGGIGLFGDSTTYQGIPERVQKELKALAPDCINALKD